MRVRSWAGVLKNAWVDIDRNHTMAIAAGLSYYFVLSLFPALIALSAVLGLIPVHNLFDRILELASQYVPADIMGVVRQIVNDVMSSHRGVLLSFGLIGTLWSASSGFSAMIEALDIAYDAPETRPFWKTRGLALLMTFLVGGLAFAALAMMVAGPGTREWLVRAHLHVVASIWPVLRWTVATACIVLAVECTYFLGPNVRQRLGHTLIGAVIAVAAWLALSYALGIYFQRFAHLNHTYGALGGAIAVMVWLYWSFFVILLGAEINGEAIKARGAGMLSKPKSPPVPEHTSGKDRAA